MPEGPAPVERAGQLAAPAERSRPVGASPWIDRLGLASAVALLIALAFIFLYAPTERVQGAVQRVFYLHLPLAIDAAVAFFIVFIASILYLWKRGAIWDVWARSAAEVGVVFTTLVLITGSIWARPIWGTWWTWDARLTTTLILWLIYLAYLVVRSYAGEPGRAARYAAVIGIIGFLDVPIIRQSVVWWRTLHPGPTVVDESGSVGMPPEMLLTLVVTYLAFTLLFAYLLLQKVRLEKAKDELTRRRTALLD